MLAGVGTLQDALTATAEITPGGRMTGTETANQLRGRQSEPSH
jgi:hypothetical protein